MRHALVVLLIVLGAGVPTAAQAQYHDNGALESALQSAASRGGSAFTLSELARDGENNPVWMMQMGEGAPHQPAVLVVAGLDGRHWVGTEMALAHIQILAGDAEASTRLLGKTVYVVPRLNPSACEVSMKGSPRREAGGSPGSWDLDLDGLTNEDMEDDLNGDGRATLVRVEHPDGTWIAEGSEDFMRPAKSGAGERGAWMLLSEGRDDDGDEAWNEEADGGVNTARNFPFLFPWFTRGAGPHQVSRPEARGLADFLAAHPEIAVVVVYGFEDNLLAAPSDKNVSDPDLNQRRWGRKPVEEINKHDQPLVADLSGAYHEALGLGKKAKNLNHGDYGVSYGVGTGAAPTPKEAVAGGLAGYTYFHRGRLTLATPAWTPGLQMALNAARDTASAGDGDKGDSGDKGSGGDSGDVDEKIQQEEAFRDWLVGNVDTGWLGWQDVTHPDFPDHRAQVGGYAPMARINPPPEELPALGEAHHTFLLGVLDRLPRVVIREASLTAVGGGLYRLEVTAENAGVLPDVIAQGVVATHARRTRLELELPRGGSVVGGPPRVLLDRFDGPGSHQERDIMLSLPQGTTVSVSLVSEMAGSDSVQLSPGQRKEGGR